MRKCMGEPAKLRTICELRSAWLYTLVQPRRLGDLWSNYRRPRSRWRFSPCCVGVFAAAEPNLVTVVPVVMIRCNGATSVSHRAPPPALQATLELRTLRRAVLVEYPFVHVARHVVCAVVTDTAGA
jgi:hypothetical protein